MLTDPQISLLQCNSGSIGHMEEIVMYGWDGGDRHW